MRWLFHVLDPAVPLTDTLAPPSLFREGFIHASYLPSVAGSAALHLPDREGLVVLQIDPRRVGCPIIEELTPRGPMPHIFGPVPRDAIVAQLPLASLAEAPDQVTGTRFGIVVLPGTTLLNLAAVIDPLCCLRTLGIDRRSSCEVLGARDDLVFADAGMTTRVFRVRPQLDEFDVVVIPGGSHVLDLTDDIDVAGWLRSFPPNRVMASVGSGALLLGAAGRLEGKRATTHDKLLGRLSRYGASAVQQPVVDDGLVITATGGLGALELGLHLVTRFAGREASELIGLHLGTLGR
jgi:cyclohexyl-isocyanide hydratase